MILKTVNEYARYLAETYGSRLAVAAHQTNCTFLVVDTSTGAASVLETIDDDYLPSDLSSIPVTSARCQSANGTCEACMEDDEFAEWAEAAENWDVHALANEILGKLIEDGVTDTWVAAWGVEV